MTTLQDMIDIHRAILAAIDDWGEVSVAIASAPSESAALDTVAEMLDTPRNAAEAVLDIQIRRLMGHERTRIADQLQELIRDNS